MADLSKLTGKFDLKGMVSNVKSIINPNAKVPGEIEGDPLGQRAIEIMQCLESLKGNCEKMAQDLTKLDNAIGNLNQQIMAAKKSSVQASKDASEPVVTAETKKAISPESKAEK